MSSKYPETSSVIEEAKTPIGRKKNASGIVSPGLYILR